MAQTVLMRSEALSPLMRRPFVVSSPLLVSHLRRLSFQSRFRNCPPLWRLGPTISLRRRSICVRATDVSQPGSIDSPMINSMQIKIKEQLNADTVIVQDANGDGRHVRCMHAYNFVIEECLNVTMTILPARSLNIYVVSSAFEGQSSVNRQRMVYKAIREELESTVHAVDQMITQTPAEAA